MVESWQGIGWEEFMSKLAVGAMDANFVVVVITTNLHSFGLNLGSGRDSSGNLGWC